MNVKVALTLFLPATYPPLNTPSYPAALTQLPGHVWSQYGDRTCPEKVTELEPIAAQRNSKTSQVQHRNITDAQNTSQGTMNDSWPDTTPHNSTALKPAARRTSALTDNKTRGNGEPRNINEAND